MPARMESCTSKPSPSTGPPRLVLLAALLAWSFQAGLARAHPISLTQAFVFVTREKATVKLDCFAEDLFLFHNLAPNDRDFLEPDVIHRGIEQHREFLLERFTIRDVRGERLNGRFVYVESPEMPAEGIRLADLMAHRVSFQVEYLFEAPPEFLTFSQDLVGDKLVVPAEVQLNVKQETAAAPSQEVLYPGKPYTLRFNWDSPPLAAGASQEAWDAWYQRQKDETLGITSYSAVYSFLYITDYEVRHEILIPLLTLEESVLIAREDDAFLEIAEQDAACDLFHRGESAANRRPRGPAGRPAGRFLRAGIQGFCAAGRAPPRALVERSRRGDLVLQHPGDTWPRACDLGSL